MIQGQALDFNQKRVCLCLSGNPLNTFQNTLEFQINGNIMIE